jgi:uncharacterized OB-fold protein
VTPEAEFREFLAAGELRFQRCKSCGALRTPPRPVCHACLSPDATWELAPANGQIVTYTVINDPTILTPEVPITLVHVELADGVRYTAPLRPPDEPSSLPGRRARWSIVAGKPEFETV